jgi:hypothetical protein
MYRLWTFLILEVALVGAQQCGTTNYTFSRFDFHSPGDRLVGGFPANPHAWTWVGEILLENSHHCGKFWTWAPDKMIELNNLGCTLIDTNFVVTAAHCFAHTRDPRLYKVLLGGHMMFSVSYDCF